MSDRLVLVRIEHELLLTGNRQEREHVAACECSDESLLGIDVRRVSEISGRRPNAPQQKYRYSIPLGFYVG